MTGSGSTGSPQANEGKAPAAKKKLRTPRGKRRERSFEELKQSELLRPHEVYRLFGIVEPTLHGYCHKLPEGERLPFVHVRGVRGRRGCVWVEQSVLKAWIRWQQLRNQDDATVARLKTFKAWMDQQETKRVA